MRDNEILKKRLVAKYYEHYRSIVSYWYYFRLWLMREDDETVADILARYISPDDVEDNYNPYTYSPYTTSPYHPGPVVQPDPYETPENETESTPIIPSIDSWDDDGGSYPTGSPNDSTQSSDVFGGGGDFAGGGAGGSWDNYS